MTPSVTASEWGPGYVIAGRYQLVARLGRGGMGSVWRADHLSLRSPVAIKLIDPAIALDPDALGRFMREAQAAAALRSPHVVQTFDYGLHEDVPYIVMELLEGDSLGARLERVTALSLEETARIITQVARAISRAHEAGIVHRDLKPDNIFLVRNEDEEVAKVLDFGIAKSVGGQLGTSSQTRTGALLGTPYYMSPEQAEGNKRVDFRTDLWALAVIAFECVVGRRPFESDALGDLVLQICVRPIPVPSRFATVAPGFDEWFRKGAAREPLERFASARELAEALRAVSGDGRKRLESQAVLDPALPEHSATRGADVARATEQRFGSTTGHGSLGVTTTPMRGPSPALIAVGVLAALLLSGVGLFLALRESDAPGATTAVAGKSPLPEDRPAPAPPPVPAPSIAPAPPVPPAASAPTVVAPVKAPAPSKIATPAAPAAPKKASVRTPVEKPSAPSREAPPKAPPPPTPTVDLGI